MIAGTQQPEAESANGGSPNEEIYPILTRSSSSAIQKSEEARGELYRVLERACAKRKLGALVLQSAPFQNPVWVKFEGWKPVEAKVLTARSSAVITVLPKPYHRYDLTYTVVWEKHGRSGEIGPLYRLEAIKIDEFLEFLCAAPDAESSRRRVKKIFSSSLLRREWWQLWWPKNKVTVIRADYFAFTSVALMLVGILITIGGVIRSSQGEHSDEQAAYAPSTPEVSAAPSAAAPPESKGRAPQDEPPSAPTVRGQLDEKSAQLPDGRSYDDYSFDKTTGSDLVIDMRSEQFHSMIIVGQTNDQGFLVLASSKPNSESAETNATVSVPAEVQGKIIIRATTAKVGEAGSYVLEVNSK